MPWTPFQRALMRTDHCQGIGEAGSGPSKGILVQCKPIVENAMFTCGQWRTFRVGAALRLFRRSGAGAPAAGGVPPSR